MLKKLKHLTKIKTRKKCEEKSEKQKHVNQWQARKKVNAHKKMNSVKNETM